MSPQSHDATARAQAFTLEGLVGAIIILTALLFALEAVVLTPTTTGGVDAQTKSELRTEADDVLTIVDQNETFDLSSYVRYWSHTKRQYYGAVSFNLGYGERQPPKSLGVLLNRTFDQRGRTYNLQLRYQPAALTERSETVSMVYRGEPSDDAVVATERVVLFDNMTLTAPRSSVIELTQIDAERTNEEGGFYPIPDAVDGPVYNVVEVRLVVW